MICFPNAKINLGLYVTALRQDGYHDLETVMVPIPLQDVLEIKPLVFLDKEFELQLAGETIEGPEEDNLVVKVFLSMKHEFNLPPQTIHLYKRIPTGGGLGGGSSDAAFMMRLLNETFHLELSSEDMERRLRTFGADCPFFVHNRIALATGIGERLEPINLNLSEFTLVLVKPSFSVSTREAYSQILPSKPAYDLKQALSSPIGKWQNTVSNDFEKSIFKKYPQIAVIKQTLYDLHALYASMSGSGSTVFGLFKNPVYELEAAFKDCFVLQKRLMVYPPTFS